MDFKTFLAKAWQEHADDTQAVADRLGDALGLIESETQIPELAHLASHVFGAHLGAWREGLDFLDRLRALPAFKADGTSEAALRRSRASLALAAQIEDTRAALSPSDRIRVGATAAATLAERDTPRAMTLFEEALAQMHAAQLPSDDPANRALAVTGNNLAAALEEKTNRTAAERELMILAAQTGRHYWEIAGTWLETERAEYRLAMTWIQAGDAGEARRHAQACLDIIEAHQGPAVERFFGCEVLARAEHSAGNGAAFVHAVAMARNALAAIESADDKSWCSETLTQLEALRFA
jgi:hypothetical protein